MSPPGRFQRDARGADARRTARDHQIDARALSTRGVAARSPHVDEQRDGQRETTSRSCKSSTVTVSVAGPGRRTTLGIRSSPTVMRGEVTMPLETFSSLSVTPDGNAEVTRFLTSASMSAGEKRRDALCTRTTSGSLSRHCPGLRAQLAAQVFARERALSCGGRGGRGRLGELLARHLCQIREVYARASRSRERFGGDLGRHADSARAKYDCAAMRGSRSPQLGSIA